MYQELTKEILHAKKWAFTKQLCTKDIIRDNLKFEDFLSPLQVMSSNDGSNNTAVSTDVLFDLYRDDSDDGDRGCYHLPYGHSKTHR